jgi:cytoskeletal protein CcmA (bactofilin family)
MRMFRKISGRIETIVGEGTEFKGELSAGNAVRIDGCLEGDVRADCVIVGENGRISGNIRAREVIVGGKVEGNIEASVFAELKTKAVVRGEIRALRLVVSEGAVFDGRSYMAAGEEAEDERGGRVIAMPPPASPS